MKLKTILGMAIAACATLVMSMAASAATDIKAGEISKNGNYVVVPIVIQSTDIEMLSNYQLTFNYDTSKYTYARLKDSLVYTDDFGDTANYGSMTTNNANNGDGTIEFVWFNSGTVFPAPDENNNIKIAEAWFSSTASEYSSSDFSVTVTKISDGLANNETHYNSTNMKSFFTFDVTGDLGGNEIVALGASTDGGATIQPLEYYVSTDWTEGMAYADATTKFLVALNNTKGTTDVADVTIYGELADGTYIPLANHSKNNFLVQTFK